MINWKTFREDTPKLKRLERYGKQWARINANIAEENRSVLARELIYRINKELELLEGELYPWHARFYRGNFEFVVLALQLIDGWNYGQDPLALDVFWRSVPWTERIQLARRLASPKLNKMADEMEELFKINLN